MPPSLTLARGVRVPAESRTILLTSMTRSGFKRRGQGSLPLPVLPGKHQRLPAASTIQPGRADCEGDLTMAEPHPSSDGADEPLTLNDPESKDCGHEDSSSREAPRVNQLPPASLAQTPDDVGSVATRPAVTINPAQYARVLERRKERLARALLTSDSNALAMLTLAMLTPCEGKGARNRHSSCNR